jgi:Monomeric isocitrate dehydrogenase
MWRTCRAAITTARKSTTVASATNARIELVGADGAVTVLKAKTPLAGRRDHRRGGDEPQGAARLLAEQIEAAKKEGVLFSLHVKATMMKISDPIVFGHAVSVFFADVIEKHAATLKRLGVNLNNGFGDLLTKIETLPAPKRRDQADIAAEYAKRPGLAMVNSDKGSQPARAQRRHRRRFDAGDDPRVRPHVGAPTASCTTPSPRSRIAPTRRCIRRPSMTVRPTARSIPRPWARSRTWG